MISFNKLLQQSHKK